MTLGSAPAIPRTIWSLWSEGRERAPELSNRCFNAWENLNPGWKLNVLDSAQALEIVGHLPDHVRHLPIQALSDIIRIHLLKQHGGIWVDATVWPTSPLERWLDDARPTGFFAFERPGPDRPISSWFLCAPPGHSLITTWAEAVNTFWQRERSPIASQNGRPVIPADPAASVAPERNGDSGAYPYFWFHYLFGYCLDAHSTFRETWQNSPKLPAAPAHILQRKCAELLRAHPAQIRLAAEASVMQKLDWRNGDHLTLLRQLQTD